MTKGILGRKVGMTQVFTENGELIPVTVIEAAQKRGTSKEKLLKLTAMKLYKSVSKIREQFCQTNPNKVM